VWAFIARQLARVPFAGASVLDVGAWDGYWSFFAERHGAREVLAVDDASQRWAADSGIALAQELLGSRIAIREDIPIYEVATLGRRFDVVLCLGVFYHLWDPLYGFAQLRHCCHRDALVVVEGEVAWGGLPANGVRYAVSSWQECVPSASALETLLRLACFRVDERVWMHPLPAAVPADGELPIDRALFVCRPFAGRNPVYQYRPHFGLAGYDDRFRSDAAAQPARRASLAAVDAPAAVEAGCEFVVRLAVANTGRGFLDDDVAAGGTAMVAVHLRAPGTPGRYLVRMDLVCEDLSWFADDGGEGLDLPLEVVSGPGAAR